jgi:hypothetical protein
MALTQSTQSFLLQLDPDGTGLASGDRVGGGDGWWVSVEVVMREVDR